MDARLIVWLFRSLFMFINDINYFYREKSYNIVNAEGKYYKDRDGGSKVLASGKLSTRGGENSGKAGYKSASTVRRQEKAGKDRKAVRTR